MKTPKIDKSYDEWTLQNISAVISGRLRVGKDNDKVPCTVGIVGDIISDAAPGFVFWWHHTPQLGFSRRPAPADSYPCPPLLINSSATEGIRRLFWSSYDASLE